MSAATTRMERTDAIAIAKAFVTELEGTYEQLIVAGSLRRRLARIGDVEIVAVPKLEIERTETVGLFGSVYSDFDVDRLDERLNAMLADGRVEKRPRSDGKTFWGPRAKYLSYRGSPVDLFTPNAERFGWILLLRTGPEKFSRQLVVPSGPIPGEVRTQTVTKDRRRGLMPPHIKQNDGWLTYRTSGERIETPTEQSVFELFGLPYQEPWERT
jgi:DNA polymerase/3'-5' exonuclease PolX